MPKKIYDILPPSTRKKEIIRPFPSSNFKKKILVIFLVGLVVLVLGHFVLLRANIYIRPETELVDYNGEINIDSSALHYDIGTGVIPGKLFIARGELSREFKSSGIEVEEVKARGTLRVFNNHSTSAQRLVTNTRFISSNGKLFKATSAVLIPGRTASGPGVAKVDVVAAEAGDYYNINNTTNFSIPGLKGTAMFTTIYAENATPILGGFRGERPIITEEDISDAKDVLYSSLIESLKIELEEANPEFIFDNNIKDTQVIKEFIRPEAGENFELFEYDLELKIRFLAFKNSDIVGLLKANKINREEEDGVAISDKEIWDDSLNFKYTVDSYSPDKEKAILLVESSALFYSVIEEGLIKEEISGMEIGEAQKTLYTLDTIKSVDINLAPPWVGVIPPINKINIEIVLD